MNGIASAVNAVKGAVGATVALRCVVAVIRERSAGDKNGLFADNALALEYVLMAVLTSNHPATPVQSDRGTGQIGDGDEVDEGVRRIWFGPFGIAKVDEAIKGRSQAIKFFARSRHV